MHCTRGPNPHFQASRDPALLRCTDTYHLFSALKPALGYTNLVTVAELCEAGSGYVADGKLVVSVKVRAQAARPPFLWRPRLCTPLRDCLSSPARLRWCIETFPVLRPLMCETAAAVGDLHLFKMLRCLTDDAYLMPWDEGTARAAARAGHHELLKLARGVGCPWEEEHMLEYAAESGSVEMATWLYEEGIRWSGKEPGIAAACGHLHFLQWALEAGGAAWDADMYTWPAATGQLDVLRWLNADLDLLSGDSGPRGWRFKVCLYAAAGGQLEVLRWATTVGSEDDPVGPLTAFIVAETLEVAAANGRRSVLDWLWAQRDWQGLSSSQREQICYVLFFAGVRKGRAEALLWAEAHGFVPTGRPPLDRLGTHFRGDHIHSVLRPHVRCRPSYCW